MNTIRLISVLVAFGVGFVLLPWIVLPRPSGARTVLDHLFLCLTAWLAPVLCFTMVFPEGLRMPRREKYLYRWLKARCGVVRMRIAGAVTANGSVSHTMIFFWNNSRKMIPRITGISAPSGSWRPFGR